MYPNAMGPRIVESKPHAMAAGKGISADARYQADNAANTAMLNIDPSFG
jgi:hypothetical protein